MKTNEPNLSWYQVPGEIENLLRSAAQSWENTQESEHYMQEAIALGDTNKEITAKVKELDDKNEFGASVVFDILTNPIDEDE
jgi:hypothetical protein